MGEQQRWWLTNGRCVCVGAVPNQRCSNTDPEESWPKGAMFQCVGCDMWCHTQCIYSSDTPPQEQPFCHVCLASMLKMQGQDAVKRETGPVPPAPLHTGRSIRAKSRVLVCAGPYGLSEVRRLPTAKLTPSLTNGLTG